MEGVPPWLKAAFSRRVDMLGQQMHVHPRYKMSWAKASKLLENLHASFSEEQRNQFGDWEDCMGLQEAREREELYVRGFLDGFQLYASLNELIDQMVVEEQAGKSDPTH